MALLSAFAEMGLKLRVDLPEQAMEVTAMFFRSATSANESHVSMLHFSKIYSCFPACLVILPNYGLFWCY